MRRTVFDWSVLLLYSLLMSVSSCLIHSESYYSYFDCYSDDYFDYYEYYS